MKVQVFSLLASFLAIADAKRKVFIDNDGLTPLNIVLPLSGDMEIVGISGSFGDPTLADALGQASGILANYSMSCIPLYAGADAPFLRTESSFETWEELFGEFVWKGAFDPNYVDAFNLSQVAYNRSLPAAMALVEAVKANPGEIEIYAAGLMTTVAQALGMYPELAKEAKAVWIMGGFIDNQYAQITGGDTINDINTDFNFMFDPEAAQKVLTAGFDKVYLGGNVTNYIFPSQTFFDLLVSKFGGYGAISNNTKYFAISEFVGNGNATQVFLPLWDEAVSAFMTFPELITDLVEAYAAVDTAFDSPFYGNLRLWPSDLKPVRGRSGKVTYVNKINDTALFDKIAIALLSDWTQYCKHGGPVDL